MSPSNFVECLSRRFGSAVGDVIQSLTDGFVHIGTGGDVQQALVGRRVLHDGGGLALYGKHHGPFALPEVLHKIARTATVSRQRLDDFGNDENASQTSPQNIAPFWVPKKFRKSLSAPLRAA